MGTLIVNQYLNADSRLLGIFESNGAAWSLRKLANNYRGSCIRVRRTDGAEQDIGFSGGVLDTSALLTFVGSNSGFVTKWYDQSGNGIHLPQTNALSQPTIVTDGVLYTEGANPAIRFPPGKFFNAGNTFLNVNERPFWSYSVARGYTTNKINSIFAKSFLGPAQNRYAVVAGDGVPSRVVFVWEGVGELAAGITRTWDYSNNSLYIAKWINDTQYFATNNGSFLSRNDALAITTSTFDFLVGAYNGATSEGDVSIQEILLTFTDETDRESAVRSNINSFYNLY